MSSITQEKSSKFPLDWTVTKLHSTLEIKQTWLYNEWAPQCQFSQHIVKYFPNRNDLDPKNPNPNIEQIQFVFEQVRGQYILWQSPRETGRWKKMEVEHLTLDWVLNNVEVLYPSTEEFEVSELNGIVLWDDKEPSSMKKYKLYEGNHRISAWLASQIPSSLPATIFVGKPQKQRSGDS